MRIPKRGKLAIGAVLVSAAIAGLTFQGSLQPVEAGGVPTVVILRCLAMEDPVYTYQVATISHTPNINLSIQAGTINGQGDNCAVAIQQILTSGMSTNKMTMQATENALVVTFLN